MLLYEVLLLPVRTTARGWTRSSQISMVELAGPQASMASRTAATLNAGRASRYACTARWKSRLSNSTLVVAPSGNPSKNRNVPNRVRTSSGTSIPGGIGVTVA